MRRLKRLYEELYHHLRVAPFDVIRLHERPENLPF
jgi:hypothetical protein